VFRFDKVERDGVLVLSLYGGLDAMTALGFKTDVVEVAEEGTKKVVVDLTNLTLIDSTGVGALISLFKRTRSQGGAVFFAGLQAQPREVFRLLRLDKSLDLFATNDEAVAKLNAG
jgi:anti-sigma B factor antagonist